MSLVRIAGGFLLLGAAIFAQDQGGYSGDGGPASSASFSGPSALTVDGVGNIYVADPGNNAIRILQPVGQFMMNAVKAQRRER